MRTTAVLTAGAAHPAALAAFERAGGRVRGLTEATLKGLAEEAANAGVVIDAILGTGARGGLRGPAADLVRAIDDARADLPAEALPWPATCPAAWTPIPVR